MREFELPSNRAANSATSNRSRSSPGTGAAAVLRLRASADADAAPDTRVDHRELPAHPGEIVWVDGATGKVLRVEPAEDVPDTIRYAADEHGTLQPIVRLVVTGREIAHVTEDGRVLRRTYRSA